MGTAWLGLATAFVLAAAAAWQFLGVTTRRAELASRLRAVTRSDPTPQLVRTLEARAADAGPMRRLGERLTAGGLGVTAVPFLLRCTAGLVALFLVMSYIGSTILAGIMTLIGVVVIKLWLDRKTEQRLEEFITQLPDIARLLSNSASAGLALKTGIEMAAREVPEPARSELQRVTDALAVGIPIEEALGDIARRLPSKEVAVLVTTLVVQQRSGGRIITALQNVATTLDARKELRREIRTVMAGVISSITVVTGLGVGSVLLLNLFDRDVFDEMIRSPVGRIVLAVSAGLYTVGFVIVRRVTRVEA